MCLLFIPEAFTSSTFHAVIGIAPLQTWSVVFIAAGTLIGWSAMRGSEGGARAGLGLAAVVSLMWAACFVIALFDGTSASPIGAIIWAALAGKDLVVCGQPLRSPLEPWVRRLTDNGE